MLRDARPAHLSRLRVPGGQIEDFALQHPEWALGLGRFASLRAERLAAGVDPTLDAASVAGERLRVTLPEAGGSTRTSMVRIGAAEGAVLVDHLVVRQG